MWKYLFRYGGGLALALIAAYIGWQQYNHAQTIESLHMQVVDLQAENRALNNSILTLEGELEHAARNQQLLEETIERVVERALQEQEDISKIDQAPEDDDGPIAPVLRDTLDRLQHQYSD